MRQTAPIIVRRRYVDVRRWLVRKNVGHLPPPLHTYPPENYHRGRLARPNPNLNLTINPNRHSLRTKQGKVCHIASFLPSLSREPVGGYTTEFCDA